MSDDDLGLPASIANAWGLGERPSKGPKRGLTMERIVEAAVRIAVTEGIAAVSMGRVAKELGAATMSLYRYVSAKDELLALMIDAAFGTPPAPLGPEEGWRDGLSRWAWGNLVVLRRHRWIVRTPVTSLPATPNQIGWFERGLASLRGTGLTEREKVSTILLVIGFARSEATLGPEFTAAVLAAGQSEEQAMVAYSRILGKLTDAERFPALTAVLEAGVFEHVDHPDDEFVFGLGRLLDGVAALIDERAR